jgi:signal transduction histidine kinase
MYDVMNYREKQRLNFNYYYHDDQANMQYSNALPSDQEFSSSHYRAYYSDILDGWIYLSFPDKLMNDRQNEWDTNRSLLYDMVFRSIVFAVLCFLSLIFLTYTAGLQPKKYGIHLTKLDQTHSDFIFTVFGISTGVLIFIIYILLNTVSPFTDFNVESMTAIYTGYISEHVYRMVMISIAVSILAAVSGVSFLSLVRIIKAGKLLKNSLFYKLIIMIYQKILLKIYRAFKDLFKIVLEGRLFRGSPKIKVLYYRQQVFLAFSFFLTILCFVLAIYEPAFILINILLQAAVMYWYYRGNDNLYADITREADNRLEEQMKAERTKVALITNVSHDLKTPLTSIISYLDLLSKEDDLTETSKDYVKVLQDKSNRLKNIVTDLFELAKSTSGDIALDIDTIDMKKLIEQTLADMDDKIEASDLHFKTILPDRPVNISADGKRLYRVFQNILDNALKYSMKGTRVFIELKTYGKEAVTTIKNTSGYEINFTSEEILQRFTRGDKSRSTEGSGLGLSIAESFTKVCGGDFKVDIDGDLFKVSLLFPTISEKEQPDIQVII